MRPVPARIPLGRATLLLPAGTLTLFLGLPVAALLLRALLDGSLGAAAATPTVMDGLVLSFTTTAFSLALTVTLGTPLAYLLARRPIRGKRLIEAVLDLPIVLPPAVAGLALLLLLGRRGPIGELLHGAGVEVAFTPAAVVLAQLFVSAPFFVRSARVGFGAVERELEDAARVDGAGEGRVFLSVTGPLAAPAMSAGLVMAWARALGEFGATILFAGSIAGRTETLPLVVYAEFGSSLQASLGAAAVLVIAALVVLLVIRTIGWRPVVALRGL